MDAKRGRGRPPLPEGEGKAGYIGFRVEKEDRERMEAAAESSGQSLSDWARDVLIRASRSIAKRAGRG